MFGQCFPGCAGARLQGCGTEQADGLPGQPVRHQAIGIAGPWRRMGSFTGVGHCRKSATGRGRGACGSVRNSAKCCELPCQLIADDPSHAAEL